MAYRPLAKNTQRFLGPTAPRKRFVLSQEPSFDSFNDFGSHSECHVLTNIEQNKRLQEYEQKVKGRFDLIVPVLKKIASIQNESDFVSKAQRISSSELAFDLPDYLLNKAWVRPLDMRALFAWCVFQTHQQTSFEFFDSDPLNGSSQSQDAKTFQTFIEDCGFHLLDVTPCSDGRLAHSIAYAMRIPFSAVRRRSHAGALFDIEGTVNRWLKTEHRRYRESVPNSAHDPTRYLKVVTYHFSSLDPKHQGCAAHGSDDEAAAKAGLQRLLDFRQAVENSFCCGASVDLLLVGLDTDTDVIRVHVPSLDNQIDLNHWVSAEDIYKVTRQLSLDKAMEIILDKIKLACPSEVEKGMAEFISRLLVNNISQIDYVRQFHGGPYPDAGHAERFIGVGIGFKEVHLRNLTYFAHLDTVEEGAPDLDVGIKIFKGLNVSRDLPIPIVIRFDYSGKVPGARERAIADCFRVNNAISSRYRELIDDGLLHTLMTIRDRDQKAPAEVVGSSLDPAIKEAH
tara:strand:- start:14890 stop:16419 length:1530 start_codon:yes stop_codon:yes gene_type:complete